MKNNDRKIEEPFKPEQTPEPPQIVDPQNDTEQGKQRIGKKAAREKKKDGGK